MLHVDEYEREEAKKKRNLINDTVENKINVQTSIEKTQQFIKEKNYVVKIPSITDELTVDNLITAVNTGYHDAIHLTLFGKNNEEVRITNLEELTQAANDDHLTDEQKREASDLLYAIQLQNEEIRGYLSK